MREAHTKRYAVGLLAAWGIMCASICCVGSAGAQTCYNVAYVTDSSNNLVQVIDVDADAGHQLVASVPVGDGPADIATDGSRMYVSNRRSNSVSVIDISLNQKIADIAVGAAPGGLAVKGPRLYVANTNSDTVSVIDTAQLAVVATIGVGHGPGKIAANPSANTVYVTNRGSGTISVIDCGSNTVTASLDAGSFPWGIALTPDGSMVCVTNMSDSTLGWISAGGGSIYSSGDVGGAPYDILVHPSSWAVYVANADDGTVSVLWGSWVWQTINTWQTIQTMTIQTGAQWGPYDLALTKDNSRLLVPTFSGGTLNVYYSSSGALQKSISLSGTPRAVASIQTCS
jgi:YVTN family beta-propeller protein